MTCDHLILQPRHELLVNGIPLWCTPDRALVNAMNGNIHRIKVRFWINQ